MIVTLHSLNTEYHLGCGDGCFQVEDGSGQRIDILDRDSPQYARKDFVNLGRMLSKLTINEAHVDGFDPVIDRWLSSMWKSGGEHHASFMKELKRSGSNVILESTSIDVLAELVFKDSPIRGRTLVLRTPLETDGPFEIVPGGSIDLNKLAAKYEASGKGLYALGAVCALGGVAAAAGPGYFMNKSIISNNNSKCYFEYE